jgi:hypothetical protein
MQAAPASVLAGAALGCVLVTRSGKHRMEDRCHSEEGARVILPSRGSGSADRRIWFGNGASCRAGPLAASTTRPTRLCAHRPDSLVGALAAVEAAWSVAAPLRGCLRIPCARAICHFEGGATPHHRLARKPARRLRNLLSAAGGLSRAPALALSACVATSIAAGATASALQQPDSRFLGPATAGVKTGYGVAGPRNDKPWRILPGCAASHRAIPAADERCYSSSTTSSPSVMRPGWTVEP